MKFLWHFTVKKTSLPLPAERLSCLHIQWVAYKHAIKKRVEKVFVDKISLRIEISCAPSPWENKGFRNLSKKIDSPWQQCSGFPLVSLKCCGYLSATAFQEYKACNLFCLDDRQKFCHFFKLGAWCKVKTLACLLRFSTLIHLSPFNHYDIPRTWVFIGSQSQSNNKNYTNLAYCFWHLFYQGADLC